MTDKKALYQPAPEHLSPPSTSSLTQGDDALATSHKAVPRIKQGVLERGNKPLTSTLKPTARTVKPLIVCHNATPVHSHLRSSSSKIEAETAMDTVQAPKTVVIRPKLVDPKDCNRKQHTNNDPWASARTAKPLVVRPKTSVIRHKPDDEKKQHTKFAQRPRFVKSRYKQAAAEVTLGSTSQLSATQKSIAKSGKELSGSNSLKTPAPKERYTGKTSTPGSATGFNFDFDESVIEKHQDGFNTMEITAENVALENFDAEIDDPDILYCRYLQWHLLNQTVKQNMRKKAKEHTEQLNFLNKKNIEQGEEIEELKQEVLLLEHQCKLEDQLDAQRSMVAPVADKLESVLGSYKMLAENLDTTRHSVPLYDTQEPDPYSLEVTLDETRNLLGQINILTRSQAPAIEKMAESVSSLQKNCTEEIQMLPAVKADLKKGVATVLHQASLACQLEASKSLN